MIPGDERLGRRAPRRGFLGRQEALHVDFGVAKISARRVHHRKDDGDIVAVENEGGDMTRRRGEGGRNGVLRD